MKTAKIGKTELDLLLRLQVRLRRWRERLRYGRLEIAALRGELRNIRGSSLIGRIVIGIVGIVLRVVGVQRGLEGVGQLDLYRVADGVAGKEIADDAGQVHIVLNNKNSGFLSRHRQDASDFGEQRFVVG